MARILTNDMLLENTRSVAQFAPSTLASFMYFLSWCSSLHRWHPSSWWSRRCGHLRWPILYHFGKHRLHSSPPDRHIQLRADSHYGDDDPTQWAQPYNLHNSHFAAIPCPNTLLDHKIIWWTPTIGDFSCPPLSGPVSGLGKLCPPRYYELRTSVIFLIDRTTKYQQSTPPQRSSPII